MLELAIGMLIAGLLIAVGMANLRRGVGGSQSQGLAQVVAEELRLARRTAMARQVPVAVGFPTNNGTVPHTQSLYNLVGEINPRMTRVANYRGDFPQAFIYSSIWPLSAGGFTTAPTDLRTNFDQAPAWPASPDPLLIFTPAGTVTSNGMAKLKDDFHLLVSNGIDYTGTGAPPGGSTLSFFSASRVSAAYTITVTPMGSVSVSGGVLSNGGVTDEPSGAGPGPAPVAPAPVMTTAANTPPTIVGTALFAAPSATLPAGVQALVAQGDHVLLRAVATDPDPDQPLSCKWFTNPVIGRFSSQAEAPMQWDPAANDGRGGWASFWEFVPDKDDPPGTSYTVTCRVSDGTAMVDTSRTVQISVPDEMIFGMDDRGAGNFDLVAANLNGDGFRYLTRTRHNETAPVASPDGARVAYLWQDDVSNPDMFYHLRQANGMGDRRICVNPVGQNAASCRPIGWAPDSSELAVMKHNGANWDLEILPLDASAPTPVATDPAVDEVCPTYNPVNRDQIAYLAGASLCIYDRVAPPPSPVVALTDAGGNTVVPTAGTNIAWSPDGTQIAFSGTAGAGLSEIWVAAVTPPAPGFAFTCTRMSDVPNRGDFNPSWRPTLPLTLAYETSTGIFQRTLAGPEVPLSAIPTDRLPGWSGDGLFVYFFRPGDSLNRLIRVPDGGGAEANLARGMPPAGHEVAPWSRRIH